MLWLVVVCLLCGGDAMKKFKTVCTVSVFVFVTHSVSLCK